MNIDAHLIDNGSIIRCKSSEVLVLEKSFKKFPPQSISLHLVGIVPADGEAEWDSSITKKFTEMIERKLKENPNAFFETNVMFNLKNAIVTDYIRLAEWFSGTFILHRSFKKLICDSKFGVATYATRTEVVKMAVSIGISFETTQGDKGESERGEKEIQVKEIVATSSDSDDFSSSNNGQEKTIDSKKRTFDEITQITANVGTRSKYLWETVEPNHTYNAVVSYFYSPNKFFINLIDNP